MVAFQSSLFRFLFQIKHWFLGQFSKDSMDSQLSFSCASSTDAGAVLDLNEDSVKVLRTQRKDCCLVVLADGLGGHNSGDVASQSAVQAVCEYIDLNNLRPHSNLLRIVSAAIEHANSAVWSLAGKDVRHKGMGTTICVLLAVGSSCCIGWVGDSRAYFLRGKALQQLTTDDTLVNLLLSQGVLSVQEAATHPDSHVLVQAVGTHENLKNLHAIQMNGLKPGDRFLLTSDGIHDVLNLTMLRALLQDHLPQAGCDLLVEAALRANSDDNLSAAIVAVQSRPASSATKPRRAT